MAAAWDRNASEAYVFLNGQRVGTQAQASGTYLKDNNHTVYDIGLKRDHRVTLKGYLRDLMVIGKAMNEEELANITGKCKVENNTKKSKIIISWIMKSSDTSSSGDYK